MPALIYSGLIFHILISYLSSVAFSTNSTVKEICCDLTGCFDTTGLTSHMPLPDCASKFDMKLTMYTRANPLEGEIFDVLGVPSIYDGRRRTVFIAHGFLSDTDSDWMKPMKDKFLQKESPQFRNFITGRANRKEDMNVVLIDWGGGSKTINYPQAASNTRTTGSRVSLAIQNLLRQPFGDSSRFWCVGHSLGSHVCGMAGKKMPPGTPLGRITGMDPAGPYFEEVADVRVGLNKECATFVDAIHSNTKMFGTRRPLGHLDVYPTGFEYGINLFSFSNFFCGSTCSHHRAIDFMMESINNDCFKTYYHCDDYKNIPDGCKADYGCKAYMGFSADKSCIRTGIIHIKVTSRAPYCPK